MTKLAGFVVCFLCSHRIAGMGARVSDQSHYHDRAFCGWRTNGHGGATAGGADDQNPEATDHRRKCGRRWRDNRREPGGQGDTRRLHDFIHHIGMSTAPALYRKLPYNPLTDFEPIGLINEVPMTLVAKKDFPAKDLKELIAYVKANKDKVNYANAGLGAASHLCGMLFMTAIQTEVTTDSL